MRKHVITDHWVVARRHPDPDLEPGTLVVHPELVEVLVCRDCGGKDGGGSDCSQHLDHGVCVCVCVLCEYTVENKFNIVTTKNIRGRTSHNELYLERKIYL